MVHVRDQCDGKAVVRVHRIVLEVEVARSCTALKELEVHRRTAAEAKRIEDIVLDIIHIARPAGNCYFHALISY